MEQSELEAQLNEIISQLDNGDIDTAVRDSAQLLATINEHRTQLHNAGQPSDAMLSYLGITAVTHIQALKGASLLRDCFETACSVVYLITREKTGNAEACFSLIPLLVEAVSTFMETLARSGQVPDDTAREHASVIISILGSMLYYAYNEYADIHPGVEVVEVAYNILNDFTTAQLVQSPLIHTPDGDVEPTDSEPLFAEIIGRAKALGFFDVQ